MTPLPADDAIRFAGRYGIQELDAGRVFDHGLWLLRDCFRPAMLLCLMVALPLELGLGVAGELLIPTESLSETVDAFPWREFSIGMALTLLHGAVAVPLAIGPLTVLYMHAYLGHDIRVASALRDGVRYFFGLSGLILGCSCALLLGTVLCMIPGILVYVFTTAATEAMIVERCGVIRDLERSVSLTSRSFLYVFFVLFGITMVTSAPSIFMEAVPWPWAQVAVSGMVTSFLYALTIPMSLALYFSLRCRHEAYDLEVLASLVDGPATTEGTVL